MASDRAYAFIVQGEVSEGLGVMWLLSAGPLSNGFFHDRKTSLDIQFWGFNSESIDEVFASHVDSTALNPIWRLGDFMAECTALPTFLLMFMAPLAVIWILCDADGWGFQSPFESVAGCLSESRMPDEYDMLLCWQVFLVLATDSNIAISQLSSKLLRIRACNKERSVEKRFSLLLEVACQRNKC